MDKEKNIPFYNDLLFKYFVYNNEDVFIKDNYRSSNAFKM